MSYDERLADPAQLYTFPINFFCFLSSNLPASMMADNQSGHIGTLCSMPFQHVKSVALVLSGVGKAQILDCDVLHAMSEPRSSKSALRHKS